MGVDLGLRVDLLSAWICWLAPRWLRLRVALIPEQGDASILGRLDEAVLKVTRELVHHIILWTGQESISLV